MSYIDLPSEFPGIIALMKYRSDTGKLIGELTEALLQGDSPLSAGERELIATYVSLQNECKFCATAHEAITRKVLLDQFDAIHPAYKCWHLRNAHEYAVQFLNYL
ncbi:carboxymuconolactone decarboxylase family protein [Nostocaceae cyanobacterium CENA357]|uniref:Carboxymuconolactone decarboxylase family protein n=1 Tax=Atlanticothrix silvestris CENA357 TaxID=1725252 RepID=A0A8J7HE14_9CYAN|nr:carboxymuconolactone decarboxylase family protein [Atlanticothrix silvestris CENA357]